MALNTRPPRRSHARHAMSAARAADALESALSELPAPWRVLRNRLVNSSDGPPWVKFIALHPAKGVALIDLPPGRPDLAIAPLDEFLARTGYAAFARGDPPIIALVADEPDAAAIGNRLEAAFDAAPRCGIENANWTEALIELLMSTPSLHLTPLARTSETQGREQNPPIVERTTTRPDDTLDPAIDIIETPPAPPKRRPLATQKSPGADRKTLLSVDALGPAIDIIETPTTPPKPRPSTGLESPATDRKTARSDDAPDPPIHVTEIAPKRPKPHPSVAPRPADVPRAPREPSFSVDPDIDRREPTITRLDAPERIEPLSSPPRPRSRTPWILAGALAAGFIVAIALYPRVSAYIGNRTLANKGDEPIALTIPPASVPAPPPATPPLAQVETPAAPPASMPDAVPVSPPPVQPAPTQSTMAAPSQGLPTVRPKPNTEIFVPPAPAAPTKSAPAAKAQRPAVTSPQNANESRAKMAANLRKPREQTPKMEPLPPPDTQETVTIDGTTYVSGREPKALGTVVPSPSDADSDSTSEPDTGPDYVP